MMNNGTNDRCRYAHKSIMNSPEFWRIYTCVQQIKYALLCVPSLKIYDEATTGTQRGEYIINIRETRLNYWRFSVPILVWASLLVVYKTCIINALPYNEIHAFGNGRFCSAAEHRESRIIYIIFSTKKNTRGCSKGTVK